MRHQQQLDRALDIGRADARLHDVLRLGAYQLHQLARVPAHAAVSTAVELAREAAGEGAARYVNQALRRLASEAGRGKRDGARGKGTHPTWLVERWRRQFGDDAAARLVAWNDTRPALTVQPVRWDDATLQARLQEAGISVTRAAFETGLRLVSGPHSSPVPRPPSLPGFSEGAFIVQDPAQALVVRFAAIPRDWRVYDACAAPGGKSVLLARAGAVVIAGDARRTRVSRLSETVTRCSEQQGIRLVAADLAAAPFAPRTLDAVLVDAPCTATGTMARHPDARWRVTPRAIARAAERQRLLLDAAAELVRTGGVLVYATCSLEPEENEDQVNRFLEQHSEFVRAPVPADVPQQLLTAAGDLQSLPFRDQIDGAYAARLRREH